MMLNDGTGAETSNNDSPHPASGHLLPKAEKEGNPAFHPQCRIYCLPKLLQRVATRLKRGQHFKAAELRVALEAVTKERYDLAIVMVGNAQTGQAA